MRYLFFILFFIPYLLSGKVNTDSLKLIWDEPSNSKTIRMEAMDRYLKLEAELRYGGLEELANAFEAMAKESGQVNFIIQAYLHKGKIKCFNSDYSGSIDYFTKLIEMSLTNQDTIKLAKGYIGLGNNYNFMGQYQKANGFYFKTLDILKPYDDNKVKRRVITGVNTNIGTIYFQLGQHNQALKYFLYAVEGCRQLKDYGLLSAAYGNISGCYHNENNFDMALLYLDSSLVLIENEGLSLFFKANTIANIGIVMLEKKDTLIAIAMTEEALEIYKAIEYDFYEASVLSVLAKIKNGAEAIEHALLALEIAKRIEVDDLQVEIYELLHTRYKELGDTKLALEMLELSHEIKDRMRKTESLIQLSEFENDNKIELIEEANQEKLNLNDKKNTTQIYIISFLLIVGFLIVIKVRSKKQKTQEIKMLNEINQLKKQSSIKLETHTLINYESAPLDKGILEIIVKNKINETDFNILNILYKDPSIPNKKIAEEVNLSIDGVRSSLKKMYNLFEIELAQNKKVALVLKVIKLSEQHID